MVADDELDRGYHLSGEAEDDVDFFYTRRQQLDRRRHRCHEMCNSSDIRTNPNNWVTVPFHSDVGAYRYTDTPLPRASSITVRRWDVEDDDA